MPADPIGEPSPKKKITIKVCGLGGAGCNAVQFIFQSDFAAIEFFAVNTDAQALAALALPNKLVLGGKRTRGLGAGGDPELGRCAAEEEVQTLRSLCAGADILFILAGMGGGTGTGASPVLARVARESGALVLALVTLPFEFEGRRRQRQADAGLQLLKAAADAVICLPNQKLFQLLDENTSVLEAFSISNGLLAEGLRGIWRMLTQTGLINVDFADLCAVARGRHAASSFATAQTTGEKRAEQLMEKLLAHPLLDGGQVLNQSDALLVSIVGGPDLTMNEVNKLMGALNRQCENAHIMFGAAIDQAFAGRISVTLIASHSRNAEPELAAAAPQSEPLAVARPQPCGHLPEDPGLASRLAAPVEDKREQSASRQPSASRKKASRLQKELPLEIIFKGRFEKSEPTICRGQDLDVPTYVRRGLALN